MKVQNPTSPPKSLERILLSGELCGEKLFKEARCIGCHGGDYLTDLKQHDVGTTDGIDAGKPLDTPTLVEVWRTAPYLYDGRAPTMMDVLRTFNPKDTHGSTSKLSDKQLADLAAYVLSL